MKVAATPALKLRWQHVRSTPENWDPSRRQLGRGCLPEDIGIPSEWLPIIRRCSGDLIGHFIPHWATNNIAFALTSFESFAAYEAYARLRGDAEGMTNFVFKEKHKFILAEEQAFLRKVVA
jgi:hypothetical protein